MVSLAKHHCAEHKRAQSFIRYRQGYNGSADKKMYANISLKTFELVINLGWPFVVKTSILGANIKAHNLIKSLVTRRKGIWLRLDLPAWLPLELHGS